MTVEIENHIEITASAETVLRFASRVEDWPRILAHYRLVRICAVRSEGRIVEMSAVRRPVPIPVRWRAIQHIDAERSRVLYRHIGGVTRGMEVEWLIRPAGPGAGVTIVHRFAPRWPWPGQWIARHVVCGFFVHAIADSTLAGIKRACEGAAQPGPWVADGHGAGTWTTGHGLSKPNKRT
jgi:Polyketide cyclase / dehydrase and lipid transport